jgi:D-ornithine 4,5-aminomutase subunit alpha
MTGMQRPSDLETRRQHLQFLTDEQLKQRFWRLAEEIVRPLYDMAYTHTSPSIERSVLLRMGFSSLEAAAVVSAAEKRHLLGKGAGHLVLKYAELSGRGTGYLEAGRSLARGEDWDVLKAALGGEGT